METHHPQVSESGELSDYREGVPVPEFILRLRERIGHDLLWLPGVTSVVLNDGAVLLVRRSDNGSWAPVTGIVDPGEHPAKAAVREVLEETGIRCVVEELVWVNVSLLERIVTAVEHVGPARLI